GVCGVQEMGGVVGVGVGAGSSQHPRGPGASARVRADTNRLSIPLYTPARRPLSSTESIFRRAHRGGAEWAEPARLTLHYHTTDSFKQRIACPGPRAL